MKEVERTSSQVGLTWNKVSGASGYEIYMKVGDGKYKKVKTITNAKTVDATISGINDTDSVTFKVRAYTKVASKKVYGAFSVGK